MLTIQTLDQKHDQPVRLLMEIPNAWDSQGIPVITHGQQGLPSSSSRIDRTLTASEKKLKKQTQPRQLLSCNKCRERKVKVSFTDLTRKFVRRI
jgi:hypothetical protein